MQRSAHTLARLSSYFITGNLTASTEIEERPFPFSDGCGVAGKKETKGADDGNDDEECNGT